MIPGGSMVTTFHTSSSFGELHLGVRQNAIAGAAVQEYRGGQAEIDNLRRGNEVLGVMAQPRPLSKAPPFPSGPSLLWATQDNVTSKHGPVQGRPPT